MENSTIGGIVALFILIIVGAIFLSTIGDEASEISATQNRINQSITFVNNGTNALGTQYIRDNNKIIPSSVFLYNGSPSSLDNAANWTAFVNGSIILTSGMENGTACYGGASCILNVTYNFFHQDYVRDAPSRTFINLIPLFFAIGLLLFVIIRAGVIRPEMFGFGKG